MNSTGDSNEPSERKTPSVLILTGTTASGKTDISIPLAEVLKGEIVGADSRQIYRELDIGTAKPTTEQLQRVPHHFVAEKSLAERWTAGDFAREARQRIAQIIARGHVPIVVGGAMLYLRALTDGLYAEDALEHADYSALREELTARGADRLYTELQECDPALASRTSPRDHHRILRGLAVWRACGIRLSDLHDHAAEPLPWPFRIYFLFGDRNETYDRVDHRVIAMVDAGLVEEVRALAERGLNEANCNALRTHGYQEVFPYLRGEITRERMIENIRMAVRHYVKRQLTWFRRDPRVTWIRRDFDEPPEIVARRIADDFLRAVND